MLNQEIDRSLVYKTQAKNTQLFTNSVAKNEVMGTTSFPNSSFRKHGGGTHQTVKEFQSSSNVRTQMSLGKLSNNSNTLPMKMGSSIGSFNSKPSSSGLFGIPAKASAIIGSGLSRDIPTTSRAQNVQMFAGPVVNQKFKVRSFQESSLMGSLSQHININKQTCMKSSSRAPAVIMQAATITGTTNIVDEENYMDRILLKPSLDNSDHVDPEIIEELMKNAKLLCAPGKGILASDESTGTCGKRFDSIGIENTELNRNVYRELLYQAEGLEKSVSGCILFDETMRQNAKDGRSLVKVLADKGIITGIKVDTGVSIIEGTNDETNTNGLEGLSVRVAEYYKMGARFAKWRGVFKIMDVIDFDGNTPDSCPSDLAIQKNAYSLARYAKICQHSGLVPIVEPEVLTDGTHDIKTCARISEKVFSAVIKELISQNVCLEGILLKPNMITSGAQAGVQDDPNNVAYYTLQTLERSIPPAVPGISFLSGGQSEESASQNLNAINKFSDAKHPWALTFSFGRALQSSVLTTWGGKKENTEAAQRTLLKRCDACSQASLGKYNGGSGSSESQYTGNYTY